MPAMICPLCAFDGDPAATSGRVAVCAGCGASLVPSTDTWKPARGPDTAALAVEELGRLRKAKGKVVREKAKGASAPSAQGDGQP